ncbi:MAG TPA: YjjG family noncanonical pyrimidine nucleotidase [Flavobacteriales bacterium]|nr:YjjG family noncanonical pyrimidine nucleotidase [Flavobacteriales bacterium]HRN38232.1 YjjG family noncanonical pyrimidine nucleotidase [Flavobacteriales bacterium]HRO39892.1 YjjG family noncanonical pyrimidine nucleotidase [Flavobacteriales bacterium]HRP82225.1 YjjG family noncanonical pyrimidine nucleotidase [Flavobacteriales bacterium]HRQ84594.1 YjjG family noncanonical pyrimidine nucleotidase [Flavobacteriales bacterium]
MARYRHLFFDLDHTLWDFRANSRTVLHELCDELLGGLGVGTDEFIGVYEGVNAALWEQLDGGAIPKEVLRKLRFKRTLAHFGITDGALSRRLEETYMERCPVRAILMPGAAALLEDLRPHYHLHIITNGFTGVQDVKLRSSGIRHHFGVVLTSEMAGAPKPNAAIFRHALRSAGARAAESLMIGDNVRADVAGARAAGMDQVHFPQEGEGDPMATYRITHLDGLRGILL